MNRRRPRPNPDCVHLKRCSDRPAWSRSSAPVSLRESLGRRRLQNGLDRFRRRTPRCARGRGSNCASDCAEGRSGDGFDARPRSGLEATWRGQVPRSLGPTRQNRGSDHQPTWTVCTSACRDGSSRSHSGRSPPPHLTACRTTARKASEDGPKSCGIRGRVPAAKRASPSAPVGCLCIPWPPTTASGTRAAARGGDFRLLAQGTRRGRVGGGCGAVSGTPTGTYNALNAQGRKSSGYGTPGVP